jgi:hypothetical protein
VPRWVKAFIVVGVLLLAVLVTTQFVGEGHGPGRHGGDAPAEDEPPVPPPKSTP